MSLVSLVWGDTPFGPLDGLEGTWFGYVGNAHSPATPTDTCYFEPIHQVQEYTRMFPIQNFVASDFVYAMSYSIRAFKPDGTSLHHETGQWQYNPVDGMVTRAGTVNRGNMFMAGGQPTTDNNGTVVLTLAADQGKPDFGMSHVPCPPPVTSAGPLVIPAHPGILNSPTTNANIPFVKFRSSYHVSGNTLCYNDTSTLLIHDEDEFSHHTANCLHKATQDYNDSTPSPPCPKLPIFCGSSPPPEALYQTAGLQEGDP
eukprot:gene577-2472_t